MRDELRAAWNDWRRRPWSRRRLSWFVGAVCLLGAALALRVWSFRQARLSGEEWWFWTIGLDIAEARNFPSLGHPISGSRALHPGPAFYWLVAVTQLFGPSPLRAFAAFSLAGLAIAVALALAVARTTDRETGLIFFVLTAASPWWIVYTNSAWPGYLFPTLCGLLLVLLARILRTRGAVAQATLAFLLVIGFQVHLSLVHYVLIAAVVAAAARPAWSRPALAIGLGIGVLCYVPYVVDEVRHGFANTIAIVHRSQGPGRSFGVLRDLVAYFIGFATTDVTYLWNQGFWYPFEPVRFWTNGGIRRTSSFFASVGAAPLSWISLVATWAVTLVSWLAFVRIAWRRLRTAPRAPTSFLPLACVTGIVGIPLFYLLSGKGGYPHYVSTILPLAFVPTALLLGPLLRHHIARWAVVAYLALFACGSVLGLRGYYAVDSRWSVPQSQAAVAFILQRTRLPGGGHRPFQLLFTFSPNWPQAYAALATRMFHEPFPVVSGAADVFRVDARIPGAPVSTSPDALVLPTLIVTHARHASGA